MQAAPTATVLAASVALAALILAPRASRADEPSGREFVAGAADRARRAVSIGPLVGIGVGHATDAGDDALQVPLRVGLGLRLFKIPVAPGRAEIEEMVKRRVKERVADRVRAMRDTGAPPPDEQELARAAVEIAAEVRAEILGQARYRGRKLERPRLALTLEYTHGLAADAREVSFTGALGLSRVTLGPTLAWGFTDGFGDALGLQVGGELAVHLTPRPRPRSHVIDVFVRGQYGATGDAVTRFDLGARLLLDLL